MQYIAVNQVAIRKILKKYLKVCGRNHLQPSAVGFLTLEVEHPHDPGG